MLAGTWLFLPALLIMCCCMSGRRHGASGQRKSPCHVQDGSADCSHRSLTSIPPDLPSNLTSLDMSHNRVRAIPPESLRPYPGLLHLSVSYNTIAKLDGRVCETLLRLQTLNVAHNQVSLREEDLGPCSGLTQLILGSNRLRLQGEPFSALQVPVPLTQRRSPLGQDHGYWSFGETPLLSKLNLQQENSCRTSEDSRASLWFDILCTSPLVCAEAEISGRFLKQAAVGQVGLSASAARAGEPQPGSK